MRPTIQTLAAVGYGAWIPLDYLQPAFGIGICAIPSSNFSGTYSVQHTFDDLSSNSQRSVKLSQSGTTITVTDPGYPKTPGGGQGHGLSANDSVVIIGSGTAVSLDATYAVQSITNQTTYTLTAAASATATSAPGCKLNALRVSTNSVINGITTNTRTDSNYAFPVRACRLYVSAMTAGYIDLVVLQGTTP
jgi:hypothetical protein